MSTDTGGTQHAFVPKGVKALINLIKATPRHRLYLFTFEIPGYRGSFVGTKNPFMDPTFHAREDRPVPISTDLIDDLRFLVTAGAVPVQIRKPNDGLLVIEM